MIINVENSFYFLIFCGNHDAFFLDTFLDKNSIFINSILNVFTVNCQILINLLHPC